MTNFDESTHFTPSKVTGNAGNNTGTIDNQSDSMFMMPGELRVIKRLGQVVNFDLGKIESAMLSAFKAVGGQSMANASSVSAKVKTFSKNVHDHIVKRNQTGRIIGVEEIQDLVELVLMRNEEYAVAKAYILYRDEQSKKREELRPTQQKQPQVLELKDSAGQIHYIDWAAYKQEIEYLCNKHNVDAVHIIELIEKSLHNDLLYNDFFDLQTLAVRQMLDRDHDYTFVASSLLLKKIEREIVTVLNLDIEVPLAHEQNESQIRLEMYRNAFVTGIIKGQQFKRIDPVISEFDLPLLAQAIVPERDYQFKYLGLRTIYDRYLLREDSTSMPFELPQTMFMRVAMGLAINEADKNQAAIDFYNTLSSFKFMSSTPTLFNSGTPHSQLSSCYLTTVPDDLYGIFGSLRDNALLSKWAGGLGNDWSSVRSIGSTIHGTGGASQGVIPFLKVANDTAVAVNQGGKRKGAVCAYLETWHLDIEEFLTLRKNTGDDRRRTHDMNTANWIPDLFMHRVIAKEDWTLFSPADCPELHDLYGEAFTKKYEEYEQLFKAGKLRGKAMPANALWKRILSMLFETGHPWITFKDSCNIRSPQQHAGVIHSSNLCTEITLNTSSIEGEAEIAVCNLGSVNIPLHIKDQELDLDELRNTIRIAMRMLDNVIDINFYPVEAAKNSNMKHRPVGLGLMGFQDALFIKKIPYQSPDALDFADELQEAISYFAIDASCDLAEERGVYESYSGSLWSRGILPFDSIELLKQQRKHLEDRNTNGESYCLLDNSNSMFDWTILREKIAAKGMRNSNTMAIAPTATIGNIVGVDASIEPTFQFVFTKSNLSGEFTVLNPYLEEDLRQLKLWDEAMRTDIKYYEGRISKIDRIPESLRELYKTSFEIDQKWLIACASRRQKWIDQAQSLNLYVESIKDNIHGVSSGKYLDDIYTLAWKAGLKTTYYLRSKSATNAESSTVTRSTLNSVQRTASAEPEAPAINACAIDDPECEACQ